jgi:hypothetical protein
MNLSSYKNNHLNKVFKTTLAFGLFCTSFAFVTENDLGCKSLKFEVDFLDFGRIIQGGALPFSLKGKNQSKVNFEVEQVMPQGIAPKVISTPSKIRVNENFEVKLKLITSKLNGPFAEYVSLISKDGETCPVKIKGWVEPVLGAYPGQVNFGNISLGNIKREVFVWSRVAPGERPVLMPDSNTLDWFNVKQEDVLLNVDGPEVTEGGSVLGIKLTLTLKKKPKDRPSLSVLADFSLKSSETIKLSLHAVGYKQ